MILDEIAARTIQRINEQKLLLPIELLSEKAFSLPKNNEFPFEAAIKRAGISFICEVKKASPSKGIIAENFDYMQTAIDYENAGADCISVLTEPYWFKGSDDYLKAISEEVSIPTLKKDFTCDSYMIFQAKLLGAKAVLLICSMLTAKQISEFLQLCDDLGLSALVEAHDKDEVKTAVSCGARLIGVNNRNLKTFEVDIDNCIRLREYVGNNVLFIAESGIKTPQDIERLCQYGIDGVLIGETLMRSENKKAALNALRGTV